MRWTSVLLFGAGVGLLAACGGDGKTAIDREAPGPLDREAPGPLDGDGDLPPINTVVGPICPSCTVAGGETSDFDGGRSPCFAFVRTTLLTDVEAEAAGLDVAAYRQRLERSFESPLRWTDLTTTSALPRSTPMAGYQPETVVRGQVTTGEVTRTFFDETACGDTCPPVSAGECRSILVNDMYNLVTAVAVATDDGAIDATLEGAIQLTLEGPVPRTVPGGETDVLSFGARADLADVSGTLRVEPRPGANRGSLHLELGYVDDSIRGRLALKFTSGWRELPGVPLDQIDEQPLVAALQEDDCPFDLPPVPLAEPQAVLGGPAPGDALAALRSLLQQTDARAAWSHVGAETIFDIELESVEHACVTRLLNLDTGTYVGHGQLVKLPIRISSSDGRLEWSALATYELGDAAANRPHRLVFEQQFTAVSSRWHEAFSAFDLAAHTDRIFLRFEARYPVPGAGSAPASDPASAVLQIFEQPNCPGNDANCWQEQADSYEAACLVAPPGGACMPFNALGRPSYW